ncbi:MAG TPA: amylo-alpha-1,6-glucosidase [Gemmatimonadaceae bacterium]|nr:amylo-alpha-1,6-glucosidase [Gemmatimonadaceae bacterium]
MTEPIRDVSVSPGQGGDLTPLLTREWLVTNGLGGYASASVACVATRKYHGVLVAALPAPLGRMVMLQNVWESVRLPDGRTIDLHNEERADAALDLDGARRLAAFRLEMGLPVWEYDIEVGTLQKRVVLEHERNTVLLHYRLLAPRGDITEVELRLRPTLQPRAYEETVRAPHPLPYRVASIDGEVEISTAREELPPLRLLLRGAASSLTLDGHMHAGELYRVESARGYDAVGDIWTPGYFAARLSEGEPVSLLASVEPWESVRALTPDEMLAAERLRRERLLELAPSAARTRVGAELVLAADQFIITPAGRVEDEARARAEGDEARTVIAGYHWFTDWGRDTMISLEGLTLATGRHREAGYILRTFAHYVRDGLIPNMFPDGSSEGLYHTADATLWFFHAVHRYVTRTGDRRTLSRILPVLRDIVAFHQRGTRFGIGVDPADGLLRQGAEGYQLTWMDAKVDDWVVTPRRGKAVEINALWYNALCLLAGWLSESGDADEARRVEEAAARVRESFNRRFWYAKGGYLYDVIDGETTDADPACRPNQVLAISLDNPVLDRDRWQPVLEVVRERLLTPVGLRSLAPGHPEYRAKYYGDLRDRDAAYHQGTVWGWLIGPFVDAWMKLHPEDRAGGRALLYGLVEHLGEFGLGSIAEIFDAESPYTPRGCIAQAWSVAEVLRAWLETAD